MKQISLVVTVFLFTLSCVPTSQVYRYHWDAAIIAPVNSNEKFYSDENIDLKFVTGQQQIGFRLTNKTSSAMRINWDELAFISPEGKSMRVIHSGVRLINRNSPQAPTTIPPKSNIEDSIVPSENIYYISGRHGGWQHHDLFYGMGEPDLLGKEFGIYLPIEIEGQRRELNFRFKVIRAVKTTD